MSFFDKKQEILKLELTTYGRYLFSKGKLKPVYYAFFDDDIIYDGQYMNLTESQNEIQNRILEETPSLKPQTTYRSVEINVQRNKSIDSHELEEMKFEEQQIEADRNYALSLPLGNSSHNSIYAPAWSLNVLEGNIDRVEEYIDNSAGTSGSLQPYLKIPQIYLKDRIIDVEITKNDSTIKPGYIELGRSISGGDIYYVQAPDISVILDIIEENSYDNNKNFDIEIFIEEKEDT